MTRTQVLNIQGGHALFVLGLSVNYGVIMGIVVSRARVIVARHTVGGFTAYLTCHVQDGSRYLLKLRLRLVLELRIE